METRRTNSGAATPAADAKAARKVMRLTFAGAELKLKRIKFSPSIVSARARRSAPVAAGDMRAL
jgi:hypothetical protein